MVGRGRIVGAACGLTFVYGLPPQGKRLIDCCGQRVEPAVVYPASGVGSWWPVPTWNLRTWLRQSLQAASVQLPAELSASSEVGATRVAMMGDQSLRRARGDREAWAARSGRQSKRRAGDLLLQPGGAVGFAVAQRCVADSGQLVGEGAGRLVVICAVLNAQCPLP